MKVYKIEFKNGSMFKVLCENRNQELRLFKVCEKQFKKGDFPKHNLEQNILNGINNISQFERFSGTIQNELKEYETNNIMRTMMNNIAKEEGWKITK